MTNTREQLEADSAAALARLRRALEGKPRDDDRTFDMPQWMADVFRSGKGGRRDAE